MTTVSQTGYWITDDHDFHRHSPKLAEWISDFLGKQKSVPVIDMGCGLGNYLAHLQGNGFKKLVGVEGSKSKASVFQNIINKDLSAPFDITKNYAGNVVSLEVGEHIPKDFQSVYVENLARHCTGFLIMSWATRNQPGLSHINCLDNYEVISAVEDAGFKYMPVDSIDARNNADEETYWFKNTILIFEKINPILTQSPKCELA